MKYNELNLKAKGSLKRVGRGISAGQGKTAGRGTKGQKSRTGSSRKPGFEGGQNPLVQRLPKLRGFKSHRSIVETVYTGQLNDLGATIDNQNLFEHGLVSSPYTKVKLIVGGEVTKKVNISLQASSLAATDAVKKAGGIFNKVPQQGRKTKKTTDKQ
ncbi:MAG: 50S ribosomal protein L15 [Candidatus Saccharimonadales bacterium]